MAIPIVIGIGIQLLLTGVVIFVLARKLRKSKFKDNVAVRVNYVPSQGGGLHHPEDDVNCGLDNQVVSTMYTIVIIMKVYVVHVTLIYTVL